MTDRLRNGRYLLLKLCTRLGERWLIVDTWRDPPGKVAEFEWGSQVHRWLAERAMESLP